MIRTEGMHDAGLAQNVDQKKDDVNGVEEKPVGFSCEKSRDVEINDGRHEGGQEKGEASGRHVARADFYRQVGTLRRRHAVSQSEAEECVEHGAAETRGETHLREAFFRDHRVRYQIWKCPCN